MLNGANRADVISAAIANGTGGMGSLQGRYSAAQLADVAAYLANPTASPAPSPSPTPAPAPAPAPVARPGPGTRPRCQHQHQRLA